MKPYLANLINAIVLILLGLWGYFGSETPSLTAFIPVVTGLILLIITPGFKKGNRVIAHIAVVLTLVIFIALIKPLSGAIERLDNAAIIHVVIMMVSSLFALALFIKSFIDARIKK